MQRVKVNTSLSNYEHVMSRVPQGSVIRPILFLLYINDLPYIFDNPTKIYLFADDDKLSLKDWIFPSSYEMIYIL